MQYIYVNSKISPYRHDSLFVYKNERLVVYKDNQYTSKFEPGLVNKLRDQSLNTYFSQVFGKPERGFWGCPVNLDKVGCVWNEEINTLLAKNIREQELNEAQIKSVIKAINKLSQYTYFIVDESKIYTFDAKEKFFKYMKPVTEGIFQNTKMVDYNAVREDGYCGVFYETEQEPIYREMLNVQTNYDYTSIVIWDADCVIPVNAEIACIAQNLSQKSIPENDFLSLFNPLMDELYLKRWAEENGEIINHFFDNGILEKEDVNELFEHAKTRHKEREQKKKECFEKADLR